MPPWRGAAAVCGLGVGLVLPLGIGSSQQLAEREPRCAMGTGEEAEVADAMEAGRQDVQEEPPHELDRLERHDLAATVLPIVLPQEADGVVRHGDEAAVGDGVGRPR